MDALTAYRICEKHGNESDFWNYVKKLCAEKIAEDIKDWRNNECYNNGREDCDGCLFLDDVEYDCLFPKAFDNEDLAYLMECIKNGKYVPSEVNK